MVGCRIGTFSPMEIKGPGRIETSAIRRKASAGAPAGGFSVAEHGDAHAQIVAGPGPIAALDSILMLQGMEDSTQGKSKGLAHGEQLLDLLDSVRDGLLAGGIPRATLNKRSEERRVGKESRSRWSPDH